MKEGSEWISKCDSILWQVLDFLGHMWQTQSPWAESSSPGHFLWHYLLSCSCGTPLISGPILCLRREEDKPPPLDPAHLHAAVERLASTPISSDGSREDRIPPTDPASLCAAAAPLFLRFPWSQHSADSCRWLQPSSGSPSRPCTVCFPAPPTASSRQRHMGSALWCRGEWGTLIFRWWWGVALDI